MKKFIKADSGKFGSDEQIKFFYKNRFLGACEPGFAECPKLLEIMKSDPELSALILDYMNSLGDPVFPVSEEDWGTPETDINNVDITDLYSTFMQELDYEYRDFPDDFYVDISVPRSGIHGLEIFIGSVAEENVVSSTKIKASRYDNVPGYKAPEGGYLYIFKHGIGPGTLPSDVEIIKTKDLPNGYTAVWLSDFLTTDELKKYDIPDETRINELLGRIGYCQKNGDVVPCDDIDACDNINGATEPNSPDVDKTKLVRQVIKQAKEIRDYFQSHNNNLNRKQEQYLEDLSDGIDNESVAAIRDAIENMKYNSKNLRSEQYNLIMDLYDEFNLAGGKFEGMGYPEDDEVNACGDIKASTRYMANMVSASDDGADESEWYDWWNDVDGYLMGWDKEFKGLIYDFRKQNGWPKDFKDPLCDKLTDVVYEYVRTHLDELDIDPSENNDSDYREFAGERMLEWLLEEPAAYDFWADYKG